MSMDLRRCRRTLDGPMLNRGVQHSFATRPGRCAFMAAVLASLVASSPITPNTYGASHFQILKTFGLGTNEGWFPYGGVIEGRDGALYGTTHHGGAYTNLSQTSGAGIVFKLNKDGSAYTVLHYFNPAVGDGEYPFAGLVEGSDGALYGTTSAGGVSNYGTIFRLNKDGSSYTNLHSFLGYSSGDGKSPEANLVEGSDGALYGTTPYGGTFTGWPRGDHPGTIFSLNKDGSNYTVLYDFAGEYQYRGDAAYPFTGLVEASDGALYGTTAAGGLGANGTVYTINKDGSGYSVLYSFDIAATGTGDGHLPMAGLVEGPDGMLYGTTEDGGAAGLGTVYTLAKDGSGYSLLYSFLIGWPFGLLPESPAPQRGRLAIGKDGALYGTSLNGGSGGGTVFTLSLDGSGYIDLYTFNTTGGGPQAGLLAASDGALYGTTLGSYWSNGGTVFKLWPPETPDMLGVVRSGAVAQVTFVGAGGFNYQVLRSTDLSNWSSLGTNLMPATGTYTLIDSSPPTAAAWYRAAWVP